METLCNERFVVTYQIEAPSYEEAKAVAWGVQVEQTIEFPYDFVTNEDIKRDIVGRLESLEPTGDGKYYLARISYGVECSAFEATQFLNVVFGNSSLQPHIWVVDIDLAPSLIDCFKGPRFGLNGIRELVKTPKRAMIQAVIKPMGISPAQLADMCKAMCRVEPM